MNKPYITLNKPHLLISHKTKASDFTNSIIIVFNLPDPNRKWVRT